MNVEIGYRGSYQAGVVRFRVGLRAAIARAARPVSLGIDDRTLQWPSGLCGAGDNGVSDTNPQRTAA
jgi:hypothetical protein